MAEVVVIGGGAAGMMAAVAAAQAGNAVGINVTLLEKNEKLGKKVALIIRRLWTFLRQMAAN